MTNQLSINKVNNAQKPTGGFESLPIFFKKTLCKVARYYDGNMYRFVLNDNTLSLVLDDNTEKKSICLIVARSLYKEQSKSFPIENKAELNKLLNLQYPQDDNFHTHIWGSDNGQSSVNIWQFDKELPKANIYLPESLLLALSAKEQQIITLSKSDTKTNEANCDNGNKSVFIGRLGNVIHSLSSTAVINSPQRFAMSVGMAPVEESINVSINSFDILAEQFSLGIKKLSFPILNTFINRPEKSNSLQLLKNISVPCLLVLSVYLVISSGYLLYKKNVLEQQLTQSSNEVSQALKVQQQLDKSQLRYLALKDFLSTQQSRTPLWLVLVDIFPKAKFSNIRIADERIILRGDTEKATTILELLSDNPRVQGAKFDFPTSKNRNRDTFVISFVLTSEVETLAKNMAGDQHD